MKRLKSKEVKDFRADQLDRQGGVCPLCLRPIQETEAVLDHCHKSGYCRGTLHRGCNSMLGKIENGLARYGLTDRAALKNYLANVVHYLDSRLDVFHPTHRTEEEKRLRRNARARKTRANRSKE